KWNAPDGPPIFPCAHLRHIMGRPDSSRKEKEAPLSKSQDEKHPGPQKMPTNRYHTTTTTTKPREDTGRTAVTGPTLPVSPWPRGAALALPSMPVPPPLFVAQVSAQKS
ncbi:hypothetical protein IscW_ISCW000740, partial [Ixodes scapularis]